MATITARKRASGGIGYTAQIRIQRKGQLVYTESQTFDKKSLADAWAARREAELNVPGALERLQHRGVTVGQVLEWYRDDYDGLAKFGTTKLSHVNFLINYPDLAELDAIALTSTQLVQHVRRRRLGGTGPSTVQNDLIWLRGAFRSAQIARGLPLSLEPIEDAVYLCRREGLIARSNQRDRRPTVDEMTRLMEWFSRGRKTKVPMSDLTLFALFSSRRVDEICNITWPDLDERRQRVLVRNMKHPRMQIDTWVDLPDRAMAVIQRRPRVEGEDRIFPYNSRTVSGAFAKGCKLLGIEDLHLHDLRHECASWLFETGLDIPRVAQVTGHRSWSSLQRYTHLQGGEVFDKWAGWEWLP